MQRSRVVFSSEGNRTSRKVPHRSYGCGQSLSAHLRVSQVAMSPQRWSYRLGHVVAPSGIAAAVHWTPPASGVAALARRLGSGFGRCRNHPGGAPSGEPSARRSRSPLRRRERRRERGPRDSSESQRTRRSGSPSGEPQQKPPRAVSSEADQAGRAGEWLLDGVFGPRSATVGLQKRMPPRLRTRTVADEALGFQRHGRVGLRAFATNQDGSADPPRSAD